MTNIIQTTFQNDNLINTYNEKCSSDTISKIIFLMNNEQNLERFETTIIEIFDKLFEKCCGDDTTLDDKNLAYAKIISISQRMIQMYCDDIEIDRKRLIVLNTILSEIFVTNSFSFISKTLDYLEACTENRYTFIYSNVVISHDLMMYHFTAEILKDLLQRIIESYTAKIKILGKKYENKITNIVLMIRKNLGDDFNNLIKDSQDKINENNKNNIMESYDMITQLTIIGCTKTVELLLNGTKQIHDLNYICKLSDIALRYKNYECHCALNEIIKRIQITKINDDTILDNKVIVIPTSEIIIDIPCESKISNYEFEDFINLNRCTCRCM